MVFYLILFLIGRLLIEFRPIKRTNFDAPEQDKGISFEPGE